ncbi:hypothetical protein SLEP1_g12312 [Rubroshorea leprosula]|uniref:Uncharacterized protein n=1 Tax=Rubroshorea leprosula TaxID=152421 RepID=A0AAV5IK48_9ROSI|nr:hypothetical protein SLEP1_g12312 [Rubroshorea leprosula]
MPRGFLIETYKYPPRATVQRHRSVYPEDPPRGFAGQSGVQIWTEEGLMVPSNLPPHPPPPILNTLPHVDHAEGGDENQPHNSAHNLASTANQDVVATQLAAMQQQFGVFQLVLSQLLARNNPGDPLINLLNPAPQPPAPQQNLELVQHTPAISESQGQSHIAPVQQPLHDDVTRRLDSLEKLVAEQRGAPPPHHAADSIPHPLNTNITLEPYPAGFRISQLETYDGTKDPDDHLHAVYSCMQAQNASDALMCKIFPSTLQGNARTWYYSLPSRSISSYTEMTFAFATKFSSRRLIRKTTSELMRVRQRDGESLKNFMSRFNDAVLEINSFDQAVGITAVISGLSHERFRDSLLKHPATTFSEVNDRSLKVITAEEYALSQNPTHIKNQHPDWGNENPNRKRMKTTQNRGPMPTSTPRFGRPSLAPPQQPAGKPPATWTPFNLPRSQIFMQIKNKMDLRRPGPMRIAATTRDRASLGLDPALLQRYDGPIYGFNNQPVPVEGVLTMNVAFGSGKSYVTLSVRFLVVKMASSFNVVIGRPTLTEIRAVGKDQTLETNPKRVLDDRQVMGVEIVDNRPEDETRVAPLEDVEEVQIDDRDPSRKTQIGTKLNPKKRAELIAFLWTNKDVFAWTSADMPGIPTSVSQHKLSTNPLKKPVAQKRRLFGGGEVKANGKWRMCIDYTNLNDACQKDCYPMPNIDKLVEAASGNERLSLLDAYSGYHQVPMAPKDEEKTSFYAGDEIYYYVMIPFGLKNAGATYQKMVTIVFQAQIGRNLEVYVDDIVVKSLKAEDHLTDLEETFNNLRRNRMRLNPAKCIFGVDSGKFLGFMVSRRGIEVNLEKIKAVAEMEPPKSVKDVQRLTGRVAALHRFISKSADKCLPSPPLLTKADDGEILYLYLGISDEAISSMLVREEGKQQKPVYYISSVLHGAEVRYSGAEVRYSIAEKVALTVVTLARKLRPYFQSHPIIVLTNQQLRQILQKPECLGRLIKWAVELECTSAHSDSQSEVDSWILYVDGASSNKGSGAGALLLGPDGYRSEHALKFNVDATNNMAEYEALLLGLQLATELKVEVIQIYSDSQLVVNQVNSVCEVVDPVMVKYAALVAELKSKFQKFHLSKIPRAENEQADSLSKFASDGNQSSRSVFVDILDEPSFLKPRVMEVSTDPSSSSWTDPIISFLRDGTVPTDKQEEMRLRKKASRYTLVNDVLYKRSFSLPLLRCLTLYEAEYALREVHEGVCESHVGARTLAHKVLRQEELTTLVAPWPFAQWGLDLLGPFMKGIGGVTHLIVGVDYFTKWVEAWALSSLTSKKVEDFVFSSIICRYGIPSQIVADNGTQFNCSSFRDFCSSYGIKLQFTSVYHPESNGMVKSVNKCILEGIKPRLEQHKAKWADELNNVLWAYRTTSRTATAREEARLRTLVYKQKITNFYNKRVRPRTFKVGDLVLRKAGLTGFETRFGKLAPNWEGPYTIAEVLHPGAYIMRDTTGKRVPRVWNVNNLKKFYP